MLYGLTEVFFYEIELSIRIRTIDFISEYCVHLRRLGSSILKTWKSLNKEIGF